jgi:hypothetical protein
MNVCYESNPPRPTGETSQLRSESLGVKLLTLYQWFQLDRVGALRVIVLYLIDAITRLLTV